MLSLERQYHEELKMELEGVSHSGPKQPSTNENVESRDQEQTDVVDDEAEDMSKSLMSRKKRGLYESMVIHNQRKKAKIEKLESRKQKLEKNRKWATNWRKRNFA